MSLRSLLKAATLLKPETTDTSAAGAYASGALTTVGSAGSAQTLNMASQPEAIFDLTLGGVTFTDGVSTSASTTFTSATAAFTAADAGLAVKGAGIATFNNIAGNGVTNGTTVTLRVAAPWSASGISFNLNRPCALTVSGVSSGKQARLRVIVRQDEMGARTVTWFAGITWPDGRMPELTSIPYAVDVFDFTTVDGGATWTPIPGTGTLGSRRQNISKHRQGQSVAFMGDSLTMQSMTYGDGTTLTSAAASGATQIVVNETPTAQHFTNNMVVIAPGTPRAEWMAIPNSPTVTGSGPYTVTLPAALTNAHPAGTTVVLRPMQIGSSSWPLLACAVSGQRARYHGTWGHTGYTPEQLRDWYLPQLLASSPDVMVGLLAHNDLNVLTAAGISTVVQQMWDRALAAGISVVDCAQLPDGNVSTAGKQDLVQVRALLGEAARARGIPVIDTYGAVVDPTSGSYQTALTSDGGTHPSGAGSDAIAAAVAAYFTTHLPPTSINLNATQTLLNPASGNPVHPALNSSNALFLTTSGSGGNVFPAGMSTTNADGTIGTSAVAAAAAGLGNAWTLTRLLGTTSNLQANMSAAGVAFIPGDYYEIAFRLKTTGVNAAAAVGFGTSTGFGVWLTNGNSTALPGLVNYARDIDGIYYWRFVMPKGHAGGNTLNLRFNLPGGVTTPQYSVAISQVTLRDLTAAGAATPIAL